MTEKGPWGKNISPSDDDLEKEGDPMENGVRKLTTELIKYISAENIQIEYDEPIRTKERTVLHIRCSERYTDVRKRIEEIAYHVNRYLAKRAKFSMTIGGDETSRQIDIVIG